MNGCLRVLRVLPVFVVLLVTSGCIKSKVTVFVNPDGSGHLVVSRLFSRQTVESVEMRRQQMDVMEMPDMPGMAEAKARMKADPFHDEKSLQREARNYGAGVKLVKSRKMDMDGGRGSIAVYSFKDINDLFVSTDFSRVQNMLYGNPMAEMGMDDGDGEAGGRRGKAGVEFSFQTGEVSRLKVLLPAFEPPDDDGSEDAERMVNADEGGDEDVAAMAEWYDPAMLGYSYAMQMANNRRYMGRFASGSMGMAAGLEVVFNGKIVSSNASHTNATSRNRIVLLDMDSSRRDKKGKQADRNNDLYNYHDINRLVSGVSKTPGAILETNREVVVAFK